jgi:hypothetical protein
MRRVYGTFCLGWRGTQLQWDRLERAVRVMAVIIIPVGFGPHNSLVGPR